MFFCATYRRLYFFSGVLDLVNSDIVNLLINSQANSLSEIPISLCRPLCAALDIVNLPQIVMLEGVPNHVTKSSTLLLYATTLRRAFDLFSTTISLFSFRPLRLVFLLKSPNLISCECFAIIFFKSRLFFLSSQIHLFVFITHKICFEILFSFPVIWCLAIQLPHSASNLIHVSLQYQFKAF
mmetsp:Transcript_30229/g.63306  ORF Transcript_30229/g.63306 Transcript_30229/m.63306 type:complete len:182 (+) Transcript_30229:84-629(+)